MFFRDNEECKFYDIILRLLSLDFLLELVVEFEIIVLFIICNNIYSDVFY